MFDRLNDDLVRIKIKLRERDRLKSILKKTMRASQPRKNAGESLERYWRKKTAT